MTAIFGVYCDSGFSKICVIEPSNVKTNSYPCFNGIVKLPVYPSGGATFQ